MKFRYYDQFNGCFAYSSNFKNLSDFFYNYQLAVDGGNDPILESYIHEKDKNGVLLYEGDIILYGVFALGDTSKFGHNPWKNLPDGVKEDDITTHMATTAVTLNIERLSLIHYWINNNPDVFGVEVIGDIHNNMELLKWRDKKQEK